MDINKQQNPRFQEITLKGLEALSTDIKKTKEGLETKIMEILKVVDNLKSNLIGSVTSSNNGLMTRLYNIIMGVEANMKDLLSETEKKCMAAIETGDDRVRSELAQLEKKIPSLDGLYSLEKRVNDLKLLTIDEVEKELPKFGYAIRDGLELLQGNDRLDKSAIKGLTEALENLEKMIGKGNQYGGGATRGGGVMFYDLSSQTNGVKTQFTVPKGKNAIILGSDFPTVLMEGNGFTLNATRTQVTLTTANPPSQGSQFLYQYTPLFNL